ncbi:MAG: ABC transporter ATP-binding protein [Lachnospiraceae bacterium]
MSEILSMSQISKKFGNIYANKDITFQVQEGEVHTLLGENGAGKSTLMNILVGLYEPSAGSIVYRGEMVKIDSPTKAVHLGIGMVHQHFMLVEAMTVFQNIILGITNERSLFIKKDKCKKEILELSEKYNLDIDLNKSITDISVGEQQRVEILKALYRGADLLILDEPTAALTELEVEGLFQIIRKLTSENKSVIFISHKMREVLEISDRITILRAGETVKTLSRKEADAQTLASLMIGKELAESEYTKISETKELIMKLTQVCYNKQSKHSGVNDVTLSIGKGEILGIAGVDGNGQSQLAQLVTGVIAPQEGEIWLNGNSVLKGSPSFYISHGISHIPEDRNKMGLIGQMSVKDNLLLKRLTTKRVSAANGWFLKRKIMHEEAIGLEKKYDIRCSSVEQETRNLSGGNQQKVILARELEENPKLLVAVHPTRGLDIGATRYVHERMIDARDHGAGVLLISADFDEILRISDRIAVMFEGKIVGIYDGANPPIDEISMAMTGKMEKELL